MALTIIKDKEAIYDVDDYDVVLVGVSTHNMLMGNFQGKIGVKFPKVKEVYESTPYGDYRKLGKRLTLDDMKPVISLMFICTYPSKKAFVDYDSLERCLKTANAEFKGKKVLTTVLGSTKFDGKGEREKCLDIIERSTPDLDLYVYDYEQIRILEEVNRQHKYFKEMKDKYKGDKEMIEKIKEMMMEMRRKTYLPEDMYYVKKKREDDEILNF